MAQIIERHVSQSGKEGDQKSDGLLRYTVIIDIDSETEQDAWDLLVATIPAEHRDMPFKDAQIEPQGAGVFYFDVSYADGDEESKQPKEEGDTAITFDSTGGTEKITHSRETISTFSPGTAPDFRGAINVTKSGVDGVEIIVPAWKFTCEKLFTTAQVNAKIQTWREFTGATNATSFTLNMDGIIQSFRTGDLRFDGVRGSKKKKGIWTFTFNFTFSKGFDTQHGDQSVMVGDIEVTAKEGWEYLWVHYRESTSNNVLVRTPAAVYIERVYRSEDFDQLGLT